MTLKMLSCGTNTDNNATAQAMPIAIRSGRQMSPNSVDRNDARLKNTAATVAPQFSIYRVMSGESYFRTGSLPWTGFLTSAVIATALLYSAAETLERRDF